MQKYLYFLVCLFVAIPLWSLPSQQFGSLGDFTLENGQVIHDCKIGYRMIGTLNETRNNAILYPTWFGGNSEAIMFLIEVRKLLDTNRYCIIAVDAFGNSVSSSPSHTSDPGKFPEFTIRDMVRAEYRLCTEILKIDHLFGMIGGSMGAMQVLEWVVTYPDFMDNAVAYVGTPRLTSYDLLLSNTILYHIELLQSYHAPDQEVVASMRRIMALCMDSPTHRNKQTKTENFSQFWQELAVNASNMNSYDFASQMRAIRSHDITKHYQGSLEKAALQIKARILFIVSQKDHIVNPQPALELSKMIKAPVVILENDMGHLAVSNELPRVIQIVDHFWSTGKLIEQGQ